MTLPLGILSTAHSHSSAYATLLAGFDDAELVAVADEDPDRGAAFADAHDLDYRAADDVLDGVDAAIVCSTNADHHRWVERAADAGVDVLCEKPLATTAETARSMVERCEDSGVSLGVAMPARFIEPMRRAKGAFDAGEIGAMKAVVGTNLLKTMSPTDGNWFVDPEASGGGAIMDHTVHVVDLVRWISGREVAEVYAETGTRFRDIPVEDVDVLSMELDDGTPFTHDGSWRQPDEWDHWGDVSLRLLGTDGVIEADLLGQTLKLTRDAGDDPGIESVFWGSDMNEGLLRDFVDAVREGREPAATGEDGLREVRVVEAAYRSADRGAPVTVERR